MQIVIRGLRCTTTLVAVTLLAGCAFGTRQPTLIYPPAAESSAIPAAQAAAKPAPKNMQIILNPFIDQRADKKVVGTVRNGFGMRTAEVIPTNNVADWVMQAMKMELQNSGYVVTTGTTSGDTLPGASAVVSGEILNVFCDMYFSYTGQISLLAKVSKAGKDVLNRNYSGEGSAGIAWGGTAESYAQSLALALASAVKQFVSELDKTFTTP
jgi:hypothetical protein